MYETALANPLAYLKQECKLFDQKYFFYILTLLSKLTRNTNVYRSQRQCIRTTAPAYVM